MRSWNRSVYIDNHDLQERLRSEIRRRWPEPQYPFHIQIAGEEATIAVAVRVWTDDGVHIFEEAIPENFSASSETDRTMAAVLGCVPPIATPRHPIAFRNFASFAVSPS